MTRRRRRQVGGSKVYKAWKDWAIGDYIIGKYVGSSIDQYDKPNWHIELEEVHMEDQTSSNGSKIEKGVTMGLNSTGTLNSKMEEVEVGDIVEIIYDGIEQLPQNHKYKGKDCHQIELFILGDEEEGDSSDLSAEI